MYHYGYFFEIIKKKLFPFNNLCKQRGVFDFKLII